MKTLVFPLLAFSLLVLTPFGVRGASSGGDDDSDGATTSEPADAAGIQFAEGMQLVEEGRFEEAREKFQKASRLRKKDADILNMLAYTQRKTGNLDDAFENYGKALALRPNFPQAREYLGEAHIQAALLQLSILAQAGDAGREEYDTLVAALRRAAETLEADAMGPGKAPAGGYGKDRDRKKR